MATRAFATGYVAALMLLTAAMAVSEERPSLCASREIVRIHNEGCRSESIPYRADGKIVPIEAASYRSDTRASMSWRRSTSTFCVFRTAGQHA
jgi:hypothetical protein